LVNREVEESVARLRAIVEAERIRRVRMEDEVKPILTTFQTALAPARGE